MLAPLNCSYLCFGNRERELYFLQESRVSESVLHAEFTAHSGKHLLIFFAGSRLSFFDTPFIKSRSAMWLVILNVFFFLSFCLFAYFNLNDKDAPVWVSIYMAAALSCLLAVFKLYYPIAWLCLILFYLAYAAVLFFAKDGVRDWAFKYNRPSLTESMQANKPYIEKAREFFGLLIISAALAINYFVYSS